MSEKQNQVKFPKSNLHFVDKFGVIDSIQNVSG